LKSWDFDENPEVQPTKSKTNFSNCFGIHPSKVEIRSIRSGQIVGKHELHFRRSEESISLIHVAENREAFARGAIAAARFLAVQSPGFYTMDDLVK
jgi:4-hydroxy-tetrahydrodipicolinate reductase